MKILEPIPVGKITLKNRLMFPPLTTGYEGRDGSITPQSRAFYTRLAKGGVGYIVIGDVNPVRSFSPTPRLHDDSQIAGFAALADSVHAYGAKLAVQIFYPEYDVEALGAMMASGDMAAVRTKMHHDMEHFTDEVTEEKLLDIINKMVECALRAQKAGIDAIQIHGDRLVGTLCSTRMNHRTDRFGGSLENRTRFARMLTQAIRKAVPDMLLDYKFSIITPERGKGGIDLCDAPQLALWLQEDGVDMLHVAQANHTGNMADTIPPMGVQPYGFFVDIAGQIKKAVNIPVSCVGRIVDPYMAERVLECGKADLVAVGRPLLCDPDWIVKIESGHPEAVRRCVSCNKGCTDSIQNRQGLSCVLNAENGHELERSIRPTASPKRVAVVGGGPAGMEAARVAALCGHSVTLWEKSAALGGQINLAAVPPRKDELRRAVSDLAAAVKHANVTLKLGQEATVPALLADKPDAVIVAVGAVSAMPPIPGKEKAHVCDAWQVLTGERNVYGKVVVIGGGLVGCETAEYLAQQGSRVAIVEMLDKLATGESETVLPTMMASFDAHGVERHTGVTVKEIAENQICCTTKEGDALLLPCDYVVMAVGARSVAFDTVALEAAGIAVKRIGDCDGQASDISNAIRTGYDAACALDSAASLRGMRYSIVYSSAGGNTAALADTVKATLPAADCAYCGAPDGADTAPDLIFVGFWTNQGTCDSATEALLTSLRGKTVVLFGTAGFGGSDEYFGQIIARVRGLLDSSNTLAGSFMCQGKMPMTVRQRYEAALPEQPERMRQMIDNFDKALSHPDAADLQKLAEKLESLL